MEETWKEPMERTFTFWEDVNPKDVRYRLISAHETLGYIDFFIPHKLINLLVENNVPKKVRVTYARSALDINKATQATTREVPEIRSEILQFEFKTKSYWREDYQIGRWEFRPPEDLFNGLAPPDTIFIRLSFSD